MRTTLRPTNFELQLKALFILVSVNVRDKVRSKSNVLNKTIFRLM